MRHDAVAGLEVEASHLTGDVRVDADLPPQGRIERTGVVDEDLCELSSQLEPVARVAGLGPHPAHVHAEARPKLEPAATSPDTRAQREAPPADVLDSTRIGQPSGV